MQWSGTSAIVSGGAGGLGEATVRSLVEAGAGVVIADLSDERGAALAADLGNRVRYVSTDVTQEDSVAAALAAAAELGVLRVAVAAHGGHVTAGRIVGKTGAPMALDGFRLTVDTYLTGTFNLLRMSAAAMTANEPDAGGERGVVICTASIAAYEGQIGQLAYAAAKAGVVGMTLVAARDLAVSGVRVLTIAPGTFYTPAFGMTEDEATERFGSAIPFPQRMGRPAEYAQLVRSIAENGYLNGETIRLDGALRFSPR